MSDEGTGSRPRRRWSALEKAAIVAELRAPGVTVDDVARRHAMSSALLYQWRKRFADGPRSGLPRFAEVIVDGGAARDAAIEIETPSLRLRVPVAARTDTLVAILGVLRREP